MSTRVARIIFDVSTIASMGRPYILEASDVAVVVENYVYNDDGSFNKHERKDITLLLSETEMATVLRLLNSMAGKVEK